MFCDCGHGLTDILKIFAIIIDVYFFQDFFVSICFFHAFSGACDILIHGFLHIVRAVDAADADPNYGKVLCRDRAWTVDAEKMALTDNAFFMHCLPVRRNMIVTDEVIESPRSLVIPEAANREISAQVVLKRLLEGLG